jgi:hypothetical protein
MQPYASKLAAAHTHVYMLHHTGAQAGKPAIARSCMLHGLAVAAAVLLWICYVQCRNVPTNSNVASCKLFTSSKSAQRKRTSAPALCTRPQVPSRKICCASPVSGCPFLPSLLPNQAEQLVWRYQQQRGVPAAIVRPSLVCAVAYEPIPGYVGNWAGPIGASGAHVAVLMSPCLVASCQNILFTYLSRPNILAV